MPRADPTPIKASDLYRNECIRLEGRISPQGYQFWEKLQYGY